MENEINKEIQSALDYFKAGEYEKAADAFILSLENDKNNPNILNNIGLCYSKLAKDDLAIEYFIKTLSFNSKSVQTYINLADVYFRNKRIIDAINLLENGVTLMPQEIALKHYLSRFYLEDCRYDLAMEQLFEILDIDADNLDAYWDLGNIQFETGCKDGISKLDVLDVCVFADLPSFYEKTKLIKWRELHLDITFW